MRAGIVCRLLPPLLALVAASSPFAIAGPCKTVNLLSNDIAQMSRGVAELTGEDTDLEWLSRARMCSVGPFTISGPADGDSHNRLVTRGDSAVASISPRGVLLYEGKGRLVLSLSDRNKDGNFDQLNYQGREAESGNAVLAVDSDLDGRTDVLHVTENDGSKRWLYFIEGEWLERVRGDTESGFLSNGEFVSGDRDAAAARVRALRAR